MSQQADDPMIGRVLGDYKITRLLGKGGMSYVYKAVDQNLDREVAIKIITIQRDRAKELMKRFKREARTMSKLDTHRNIVTVYRYGSEDDDTHYMAMELIKGETLSQRLGRYKRKKSYMPFDEIVKILEQTAEALDFAHKNNVVHRDVKPSNIMLEKDSDRVVLMDFGLVMDAGTQSTLGTAFGTPRYIAPEQAISSQQAVPQSDIYSLGVILYEMLTGVTPFDEESAMSLALSHITNPPPPPRLSRPDLPEKVEIVVLKTLEKQPEDRYQTAKAMVEAFKAAIVGASWEGTTEEIIMASGKPESTPMASPTPPMSKNAEAAIPKPVHMPYVAKADNPAPAKESKPKFPFTRVASAFVILLLIAGVAFVLLSSGGDNKNSSDDNNSVENGSQSDGDNIRLLYNNDSFTLYNNSDNMVNITHLNFTLPDKSRRLDTQYWGASTIQNIEPRQCIMVFFRTSPVEPPDECDRVIDFPHQRRNQESYYWVWDSSVNTEADFLVTLRDTDDPESVDEVLTTCKVRSGQCAFSLPQPEE